MQEFYPEKIEYIGDYRDERDRKENPAVKVKPNAYHAARNLERPTSRKPKRAAAAVETPKHQLQTTVPRRVCRSCKKEWTVDHACPPPPPTRPDPQKYLQVVVSNGLFVGPELSPKGRATYNAKKVTANKPLEMKSGSDLTPSEPIKLIALRTDPDLIDTIEELGQEIALTDDSDVHIVTLPISVRKNLEIEQLDDGEENLIPDYQGVVCDMIAMAGEADWTHVFAQCRELIMLNRGRQ